VRPGMTSIFRFSSGTQRLWITSAVVPMTSTRVRMGMWSSFAVVACPCPYPISQNHWCPITWTVSAVDFGDGAAVERITKTSDQMNRAVRRTIGVPIPRPTTSLVAARSLPPNGSASRLRRIQPSNSSVAMTVRPTQAPPNITHQSVVMLCSGPECGVSTD